MGVKRPEHKADSPFPECMDLYFRFPFFVFMACLDTGARFVVVLVVAVTVIITYYYYYYLFQFYTGSIWKARCCYVCSIIVVIVFIMRKLFNDNKEVHMNEECEFIYLTLFCSNNTITCLQPSTWFFLCETRDPCKLDWRVNDFSVLQLDYSPLCLM
jgi:hypothetical protein